MVAITPEHYNRVCRLLEHGATPQTPFDIETEYSKEDQMGFNIIGEIPGTTKKDEIVMLGGHFDSWQGGTGATDNGTGSSVAIEAVRILTTLHRPMARTVRIALWGGEEEGLRIQGICATALCSSRHDEADPGVRKIGCDLQRRLRHRDASVASPPQAPIITAVIFSSWIAPIRDLEITAVTGATATLTREPGGSDHTSFLWIGLPGFGFMQDPMEYAT